MRSALRNMFGRRSNSVRKPTARPRLEVQQLDDRVVPSTIPVTYHGGPVIAHANVSDIFWGQNWNADDPTGTLRHNMTRFMGDIVKSPYMAQLGEYGIGRGSIGTPIDPVYSGPTKSSTVTEAQIQSMLTHEILSGRVPFPSGQQLYFVYLSPGVTSAFDRAHGYGGHHHSFELLPALPLFPVYYAVIPDTNFNSVGRLTEVSSHELAEAVTDPDGKSGWYDSGGNEIGDGLEGQKANLVVANHSWVVQKEWSNYYGRGIVADGTKAGMLDAPTTFPFYYAYFSYVAGNTWNNGGWTTNYEYATGYDGLFYDNFVTAAGDYAGWFTVQP